MKDLTELLQEAQSAIRAATDLKALEQCRVHFLGKKGVLTEYLKSLGQLPASDRPLIGQKVNALKEEIVNLLEIQKNHLQAELIQTKISSETLDVTLDGLHQSIGTLHPVSKTCEELRRIFTQMGFLFMEGPEVETDYYNFTALNVPPLHPARAMQDTFYFENGSLLRSQMSPVQIHAMSKLTPPLRMVALGRVYRRDFDLTHTPMFHQMECLLIDEHISFADLKGLLKQFLQEFFSPDVAIRLRPSYFPFTEPSAEVDISCFNCKGLGCRICKQTGWIEVLGCGMVHPNVLKEVNIDTDRFQGFAFGVGIDRLALLKYGISDLRSLFENDLRFLTQFSYS